jgi:hypothetical protein
MDDKIMDMSSCFVSQKSSCFYLFLNVHCRVSAKFCREFGFLHHAVLLHRRRGTHYHHLLCICLMFRFCDGKSFTSYCTQSTYFTVRGQSILFLSSSKILTPHPPLHPASVYPPPLLRGEDRLAGRRGGWGVNILEDERNRIAFLQ